MAVLTHRAEQALLGAMLAEPALPAVLDYVETGDFLAREHRVLHAALMMASDSWGGKGSWRDAVAAEAAPEISRDYLDELVAACPNPLHGRAYAALVVEAYTRRILLEASEELAEQAETLAYDTGRLVRAHGAGGAEATTLAGHTAKVAWSFRGFGLQFTPDAVSAPVIPPPVPAGRARQEEILLGALIAGHRETGRVLGFLVPGAFGDPFRRGIFTAIRTLYAAGREIDPLTVDWELARKRVVPAGGEALVTSDHPSYVTRIAARAARADRVEHLAYELAKGPSHAVTGEGSAQGTPGRARLRGHSLLPTDVNGKPGFSERRLPGTPGGERPRGQEM